METPSISHFLWKFRIQQGSYTKWLGRWHTIDFDKSGNKQQQQKRNWNRFVAHEKRKIIKIIFLFFWNNKFERNIANWCAGMCNQWLSRLEKFRSSPCRYLIPRTQFNNSIAFVDYYYFFKYLRINDSTLVLHFIFHHENPSESDGRIWNKTLLVVVSFMLLVAVICYLSEFICLVLSQKLRNSDCRDTVTP